MSAHYDRVAADEQIRHSQTAADVSFEYRQEDAALTAHIALAEMGGSELLQMCADDPGLDFRLVILIERVTMLAVAIPGTSLAAYQDDVMRAAMDLKSAMVGVLSERRVKAVTR